MYHYTQTVPQETVFRLIKRINIGEFLGGLASNQSVRYKPLEKRDVKIYILLHPFPTEVFVPDSQFETCSHGPKSPRVLYYSIMKKKKKNAISELFFFTNAHQINNLI